MTMLSRSQWAAGPRKSGTYQAYVNWYRKHQAAVTPPKNPLAPWTDQQIQNYAAKLVNDQLAPQESTIRNAASGDIGAIQAASAAPRSVPAM